MQSKLKNFQVNETKTEKYEIKDHGIYNWKKRLNSLLHTKISRQPSGQRSIYFKTKIISSMLNK